MLRDMRDMTVEQGLRQRIRDLLEERDDARAQIRPSQSAVVEVESALREMRQMMGRMERVVAQLTIHLNEQRENIRPDVLTSTQAAEMLGIPSTMLAAMRDDGSGPAFVRIGGRQVRYTRRAVDAWLRRHEASRVA